MPLRPLSAVPLLLLLAGCAEWIPDYAIDPPPPPPTVVVIDEPGFHAVVELYAGGGFPARPCVELGEFECPSCYPCRDPGYAHWHRQMAEGVTALGGDGMYGIRWEGGVLRGVVFEYLPERVRFKKSPGWCGTR